MDIMDKEIFYTDSNDEIISVVDTKLINMPIGARQSIRRNIYNTQWEEYTPLIEAFPVGAIYTSITGVNPATELGYGTWSAFGAGRVLVGLDSGDTNFDTVEKTGGSKTHTLIGSEMPSHSHTITTYTGTAGVTTGLFQDANVKTAANVTSSTAGNGQAHNNLQPYIVVYMWKRTA